MFPKVDAFSFAKKNRFFLALGVVLKGTMMSFGYGEVGGTSSKKEESPTWPKVYNYWPMRVEDRNYETQQLERAKVLGPLVEQTYVEPRTMLTIRPITLNYHDSIAQSTDSYILYPVFSHHKKPNHERWSILGLIQSRTTKFPSGSRVHDSMAFPIYFYRDTGDKRTSYEAVFPLGGKMYYFFGKDEFAFFAWPLWLKTRVKTETHYSTPWPLIQGQTGKDCGGGAIWPISGHFWKKEKYDNRFNIWPLMYCYKDKLDNPIPRVRKGFLPLYSLETNADFNDTTVVWPFFGTRHEYKPVYTERRLFWPLLVQGRGEKKYVCRFAPVYTHSIKKGVDKHWYCWPLVKHTEWNAKGLDFDQTQFLYFLFWSQRQTSYLNPNLPSAEKTHIWPLFSYWDNGAGRIQFQMLSPLEVFLQHDKPVKDLYSPIFAIYRYNQPCPGTASESLFWDFITEKKTPTRKQLTIGPLIDYSSEKGKAHFNLLKGFISYSKEKNKKSFKFMWLSFNGNGKSNRRRAR